MQPGKIYVGSEHKTYADEWMKSNHHGKAYSEFIEKHIGFPVTIVTNGPRREEFIRRG